MTTCDLRIYEEVQMYRFGHHPIGKPFLYVYVFVVDGLLIDTGQSKARKQVLSALDDQKIEQVMITHHHEDHTGNVQQVLDHFKAPIYASPKCCKLMLNPPPISFAQRLVWGERPATDCLQAIEGTLQTQHYQFELIPIPGHAADMVALYEPSRQWLFSADVFVNAYIGYFLPEESILEQIQSIQRMLSLDFKVLLCSHNPRLKDGRAKLTAKLHFLEDFYDRVTNCYQQGNDAKQVYQTLKMKEYKYINWWSGGKLSKMNMVRSAIRDYEEGGIRKGPSH